MFEPLDPTEIEQDLLTLLEEFLARAEVSVLRVEEKTLMPVVDNYFMRLPPFGSGKNKAEFPDAIAIETLRDWCKIHSKTMAVITRDKGVRAACSQDGPLYHFEDLPRYLDGVSSDNEALSRFIRETIQLPENSAKIFENAKLAFPNLGFFLSDQDGDVENVELKKIEYDGAIEIISLSLYETIVERPATLTFTADISYPEPGTGYYDREEDIMLLQEMREVRVTRRAHRSVAARVWCADAKPNSFTIQDVWFEDERDIAVRSDYEEDWPYK